MSLKVDLFKVLITPFLDEFGRRTAQKLADRLYGKEDKEEDEGEKKDTAAKGS